MRKIAILLAAIISTEAQAFYLPSYTFGTLSDFSEWQAYTPTFTGFGTVSTQNFKFMRLGKTRFIQGVFTSGTPTGVEARVSYPSGCTSSSSYVDNQQVGVASRDTAAALPMAVLVGQSKTYMTFGTIGVVGLSALSTRLGNVLVLASDVFTVDVRLECQ